MEDVQFNNFTAINTNSVTYNDGGNVTANCVFNFQQFTTIPTTTVTYALGTSLIECNATNSVLNFSRNTSSNTTFPIGMTYDITGTGIQGFDYSRMKGFEIIPYSSLTQSDTFSVLANTIVEPIKQNTVTMDTSSLYTTNSIAQNVIIEDCTALSIVQNNFETNKIYIYPNPTNDILNISFANQSNSKQQVLIFNAIGQFYKKLELKQSQAINISDLPNGQYFIKLSNYSNTTQKFIKQ